MKVRDLPEGARLRINILGEMVPAVLGRLDGSYFNCRRTDLPDGDRNAAFQLWQGEDVVEAADGVYELDPTQEC